MPEDQPPAETDPTPEATAESQVVEVTLPVAEVERWKARAAEAGHFEDRLKRAQAEFVNESRRIARQAEQDRRFAVEQLAQDLVPLTESLDAALAAGAAIPAAEPLAAGVRLVATQLEDTLKRHGIELMRPLGQAFDPLAHEAVRMVERADLPPHTVADVIRPGLRLHGRVVRPAQVSVVRPPASAAGGPGPQDA